MAEHGQRVHVPVLGDRRGGPVARAHRGTKYSDFAFAQQMNPTLAPPDWRPLFLDYLYLGPTNATAFSPTDVMA